MKKFFKNFGRKSPSKGPPPGGSPKLGATAKPSNSTSSLIGYDVKEKELSKLHKAAWLNDVGKVRQLAKKDPSCLDKENRTPLHLACARGHADVVEALLEWKAKTNIGDNNTKTPLMKAVEGGYEDCVGLLLESRVDVDAMDKDGNTCLHMACNFNDADIAALLVQRKARLDTKNKEGLPPLHYAVMGKNEELCRLLLRGGADVNSEDLTGRTCLMKACQEGSINLVKILLEFDADTAHKDTKGWTADDCAVIQGHHACSQLISDHNVRQNMANRTPASTPRSSLPPSLAATPRDKSLELGAPALDAGGDDDDDETLSKGSEGGAKGAGYDDSWGDDSLSLAVDDKKVKKQDSSDIEGELEDEVAGHKVSLAKFIPDSDDGDSSRASKMARLDEEEDEAEPDDARLMKRDSTKSVQSNTSWEDDSSWSIQEPKKTTPRVSFKKGEELSQIHDISVPDSEEDRHSAEGKPISTMAPSQQTGSYVPTGMSVAPIVTPISADKQRAPGNKTAFMEELGISDADDLSEADVSEMSGADPKKTAAKTDDDSDWDSTALSDPMSTPRPGILKNWKKQSNVDEEEEMEEDDRGGGGQRLGKPNDSHEEPESSVWDSTTVEAAIREDNPPPLPTSPIPERNNISVWDSDIEEGVVPDKQPVTSQVEAMLRQKQIECQDTDEELDEDFFEREDELESLPTEHIGTSVPDDVVDSGEVVEIFAEPDAVQILQSEQKFDGNLGQHAESVLDPDKISVLQAEPVTQEVTGVMVFSNGETTQTADTEQNTTAVTVVMDLHFSDDEEEEDSMRIGVKQQDVHDVSNQESDWDSTVGMVTPRQNAGLGFKEVRPGDEDEDLSELGEEEGDRPLQPVVDQVQRAISQIAGVHATPREDEKKGKGAQEKEEEEDDSEWDSDPDLLPSDNAPGPPQSKVTTGQRVSQHSRSGDSDEDVDTETISEWEIERKKQKESAKISGALIDFEDITDLTQGNNDSEAARLQAEEVENQRKREEELRRKEEEERRQAEEERKRQEDELRREQEQRLKEEAEAEERRREAEERRREAERQREEELRQEEERRREVEEELKRHEEWEREEQHRQEQLKREAAAALEAERQDLADLSSGEDSFADKDVVDHGQEKEEDDFELSDKDIPMMGDKVKYGTAVTDGAPSILMTEFDGSVEELKRIEEQVQQENLLGKKTSSENDAIKKSVKELSQSSYANQSTTAKAQVQPMVRQQAVYVPPPSLPPSKSMSQMLKKRLQVPPPSQVALQNRMEEFDDEDSYASDNGTPDSPRNERPDVTSYYPNLLGSGGPGYNFNLAVEDDALSYTSTEFETESIVGRSTEYSPFNKDMLLNLNMNDPTTLLKLQEHFRDQRRQFEQEKNHRQMLENKLKLLNTDRTEFQKKIETLTQHKLSLEQGKLDLEAKIRGLQYNITEEEEKRRNAEVLLEKTKDQLNRKEEKYTSSVEEKQKAELERRNMVMELRAINNRVKELEGEREELERLLEHERETRLLQEKINEEQTKFHEQLQQEKVKAVSQLMEKRSSHTGDDSDEGRMEVNETLKAELFALQAEVERQRARSKDENALLSAENEDLHTKIEELKNEIKLNEEALTQATMQYSVQIGSLKTDHNVQSSELEKEKAAAEKLEAELESQRTRLLSTTSEMEKASQARNELERELQHSREELRKEMERKETEIEKFKETNRELTEKLHTTDVKMNSLEKELHVANTSLLERTNQLKQINHNLDSLKTSLDNMDQNYKMEKEHNSKLLTKIETLQEKLTQAQHDSLNLKQQLETVRQAALQDASMDAHEKFNTMMASLKTEHEKSKEVFEEKNSTLSETITRMREEMRNAENRRSTLETDMRHHSQEQNELIKKLSHAEASLELAQKMKDQIDQERNQLKLEVERLQQKYQTAHEKSVESQARVSELVDRMERAEQSSLASSQQLLHTSANIQAFSKSKDEVEGNFQKILIENTRLEADLKHEKQRAEMLHQDLQDSQKVRSSLEALCSNLKSTNAHLEDKLGPSDDLGGSIKESNEETANRTVLQQEAEDSKGLWEQEVVSRSKLGLRIAQLDRQKQEAQGSVEEERKKSRKALESKKIAESKLEAEREKSLQLQKEVTTLKVHLKNAKKRVKDPTLSDSCVINLNHEFDKERFEMDEALTAARRQTGDPSGVHGGGGSTNVDQIRAELEAKYRQELNRKLEEVNHYLEDQARARDRLDMSRGENESRISLDKKRLEDENLDLKLKYEKAVAKCETKEMEVRRFRELYDSEMKWRMRLSDQLERASSRAGDYKTKLAVERNHRTKFISSMNNLNVSAISNGMSMDASRLNTSMDDPLSNKLRAELDRSIAKHLEAAPHDDTVPVVWTSEKSVLDSSFAKSSAEYYEILKKKYCI